MKAKQPPETSRNIEAELLNNEEQIKEWQRHYEEESRPAIKENIAFYIKVLYWHKEKLIKQQHANKPVQ